MKNQTTELTTSKMPRETEKQFTAFLLYCEVGSVSKLIQAWEQISRSSAGELSVIFGSKLGNLPSKRAIERWSVKYQWVKRADAKLAEDLEGLKKKTTQIRQKRAYLITEAFWNKLQSLRKQMQAGESTTVQEVRILWEMMRVEWGESVGKYEVAKNYIDEDEQKPLTPAEVELSRRVSEVIKDWNDEQIGAGKYYKHEKDNAA